MSRDDEAPPTPEEAARAAALARALEGEALSGEERAALDDGALGAAGLARFARDAAPSEEGLARVRAGLARPTIVRRRWLPFGLLGALGAAAAVAVFVLSSTRATALPAPGRELLEAQLDAARGGDQARYEARLARWRERVHAALDARYGARR